MSDGDRLIWASASTTAGWLLLLGYLAIAAARIDQARQTTVAGFGEGLWSQRIEIVSSVAVPQQLAVLVLAAVAAIAAALFGMGTPAELEPWTDRLVRVVAGTAIVAIALALVGTAAVVARDRDTGGDFGDLISRLGGVAVALAVVRLCLAAEHRRQAPSSPSR